MEKVSEYIAYSIHTGKLGMSVCMIRSQKFFQDRKKTVSVPRKRPVIQKQIPSVTGLFMMPFIQRTGNALNCNKQPFICHFSKTENHIGFSVIRDNRKYPE